MRKYCVYIIIIGLSFTYKAAAQTKPVSSANKPVNSSDSLKQAMANLKSLFGGKRDTILITVADVDYDDSDLANLKDNIKIMKGVKSLTMQYKAGNASLQVCYKGNSTNLWDNLPPLTKKPFKLLEENDTSISLKFKTAKPLQ